MSIIEKVFKYEATELPVIKYEDEIWFKAVVVATILKYTNQRKAIRDHVDSGDKRKLSEIGLGSKRNESFPFKKGYLRGSPDLIINNLHKHYTGFCIEFKNPKGNGVLSPDQSMMLRQYQNNGFKTLVSNDYDQIIEQIIEYFRNVRLLCSYCPRRFVSPQSLSNHIKIFHKM